MSKSLAPPLSTERPPAAEAAPPAAAPMRPHWKSVARRKVAVASRWLHIYLSLASFTILFFFAATGLTVNHQEWFAGKQKIVRFQGTLDRAWLRGPNVAKLEIAERLRSAHKLSGAVKDFRVDDSQLSLSFKGPGYAADIFIDRATGAYDVTETRMGFGAIVNDLHKGRDAGDAWKAIIDISAAIMCLVSLTGLLLIFFLQKKRSSGLLALAIGTAVCYAVYAIWTP
jgi:uncharacterized protein